MNSAKKPALFDSVSRAALRVRTILREHGIRLPQEIDVQAIASLRGAFVREETLEGCDGRLIKKGRHGIISVRADTAEMGKKRFTIAHELGHFELHDQSADLIMCSGEDVDQWAARGTPTEVEANIFAVELLMPEDMFKPRCQNVQPRVEVIQTLADDFRAGLTATAFRYITFCPFRCAIVLSRNNKIERAKWTEDFGYVVPRHWKLDVHSIAAEFFAHNRVSPEPFRVPASAWLDSEKLSPRATVTEQSWGFKNYGFVLTLLWLDEDFEREEDNDDEDEDEERYV